MSFRFELLKNYRRAKAGTVDRATVRINGSNRYAMKTVLLLACTLFSVSVFAQTQTPEPSILNTVDGKLNPPFDPSKNVLDLVQAAIKRIDDINILDVKIIDEKFKHLGSVIDLQDRITKLQAEHNADNIRNNTDEIKLRAEYQKELDEKESRRLDAIRAVDQAAVKNEADRAQQAVSTLATAQAATAETLRASVNTTATNIATQLDRTTAAIVERIASLEKAQYTGAGRSTVADPQVEVLKAAVEKLSIQQSQNAGKTEGIGVSGSVLAIIASLIIAAGAIIVSRKHPPAPQIVYVPSSVNGGSGIPKSVV